MTTERIAKPALDAAPDSLDAAWAEAEAALPEGWWLRVVQGGDSAQAAAYMVGTGPFGEQSASGPTPAQALRALASRLRDAAREPLA